MKNSTKSISTINLAITNAQSFKCPLLVIDWKVSVSLDYAAVFASSYFKHIG